MVTQIKNSKYLTIYPSFKKEYPVLYEKACNNTLDMSQFEYMANKAKEIEKNNISQHDASVEIGQQLYDKFVGGLTSPLPPPADCA